MAPVPMEPTIRYYKRADLPKVPTIIVRCCREWPVAMSFPPSWGRCGLCGEVPVYEREDDGSPLDKGPHEA